MFRHRHGALRDGRRAHSPAAVYVLLAAIFVIVDTGFPRCGLIRIDAYDQLLVDLRDSRR